MERRGLGCIEGSFGLWDPGLYPVHPAPSWGPSAVSAESLGSGLQYQSFEALRHLSFVQLFGQSHCIIISKCYKGRRGLK